MLGPGLLSLRILVSLFSDLEFRAQANDDSWKKLMKKSGKRFQSVVARVQKTNAMELASIYAPLQDEIVHRKKLVLMNRDA